MLYDMQHTQKTAGETAKTKPAWGAVAVIGLFVAFATIETNIIIALMGAAMLAIGAYMGGYMDETKRDLHDSMAKPNQKQERRAA